MSCNFLGLLVLQRQLVVAAGIQVLLSHRYSIPGSIPCQEQCGSPRMLLQDPASWLGHPYRQSALGLGPEVRISEPLLLFSRAFLSKFIGNNCEGLMITLLVISPLSVWAASVQLFH